MIRVPGFEMIGLRPPWQKIQGSRASGFLGFRDLRPFGTVMFHAKLTGRYRKLSARAFDNVRGSWVRFPSGESDCFHRPTFVELCATLQKHRQPNNLGK